MQGAPPANRNCARERGQRRRRLIALTVAMLYIAGAGERHVGAQANADEEYVGPLVSKALESAEVRRGDPLEQSGDQQQRHDCDGAHLLS